MKPLFLLFFLSFFALLLTSCEVKQQPIAYGHANCEHCQMTVSDQRYAAELVIKTGKAYFFDSAECLLLYLEEKPEMKEKAQILLVSDYSKPGTLVPSEKTVFLQSKNLPSPMGMYLTAFSDKPTATAMQQQHGGRLLTWDEAVKAVKNQDR